MPVSHGAVANGWYDRELAEHQFWKQSNHLVHGAKLWEKARAARPGFTCAKLFWWYNMYSTADWSITPRPMYPADGRKVFDVYTSAAGNAGGDQTRSRTVSVSRLRGPLAGIASSEWIAQSAEWIEERHRPDLSLVYLPHLDYNLQRLGPDDPRLAEDYRAIDRVAGRLLDFFAKRGVRPVILSEYGITVSAALNCAESGVSGARLDRGQGRDGTRVNGLRREQGVRNRRPSGRAHLRERPFLAHAARTVVEGVDGVAQVLDAQASGTRDSTTRGRATWLLFRPRMRGSRCYCGGRRNHFARYVDIHKYGYDPVNCSLIPRWPRRN